MYISQRRVNISEVIEIVNSVADKTREELIAIYGKNYHQPVCEVIFKAPEKHLIRLKSTGEPVGIFGLTHEGEDIGGIFLLTTDKLHQGNVLTFLRGAETQINEWMNDYKLIMDNWYKKNETILKWLKLLGFQPSNIQNDEFQIYYKGDIKLYDK